MKTSKVLTVIGNSTLTLAASALAAACSPSQKQFFTPMDPSSSSASDSSPSSGVGSSSSSVGGVFGSASPIVYRDPSTTVCEPFGDATVSQSLVGAGHGLIASLKYLTDNMPRYTSVTDMQTYGVPLNENIFFFDVNVPTRLFSQGFINQNGVPFTTPDGTLLSQYFSLHYDSQLLAPAGSATKNYQFAVLSDDGSIVQTNSGGGFQAIINNDSVHATRMGCAMAPVSISAAQGTPITIDYFQGPPTEIALVLMFREWSDDSNGGASFDPNDPLCGAAGNGEFFDDSTNPSTPTQNYQDLLSRGWNVVPAQYYYLPGNPPPVNPCQ